MHIAGTVYKDIERAHILHDILGSSLDVLGRTRVELEKFSLQPLKLSNL